MLKFRMSHLTLLWNFRFGKYTGSSDWKCTQCTEYNRKFSGRIDDN